MLVLLAGCSRVELISGDSDQVSYRSKFSANPGPDAVAHCRRYGRTAELIQRAEDGSGVFATYKFACRPSS